MPGFLFTPLARWLGAAVAVLVVLGSVYFKGRFDEREVCNQYKAEVQAVADAQAQDTAKKDKKNAKLITETKDAYNNQLNNLRAYYSLRNTKSGGTLSAISNAPKGIDDYSPDNLPPTPVLAAQCAEETLRLIKLQEFNSNIANNWE